MKREIGEGSGDFERETERVAVLGSGGGCAKWSGAAVPEKEAVGEEAPDAWVPVVSGKKKEGKGKGEGRARAGADRSAGLMPCSAPGVAQLLPFPFFLFCFHFSIFCFLFSNLCVV
jgi:hypothetical protein